MGGKLRTARDGGNPVVGWRLWRVSGDRLRSWAVDRVWSPGDNLAECLDPVPCPSPPGRRCHCGFWALWSAEACYAQIYPGRGPLVVMGLVEAWGSVAVHGREGFRAQYSAVRCLFTDRLPNGGEHNRVAEWIMTRLGRPKSPDDGHEGVQALERVAYAYGVPLLSVAGAERLGVLSEFGVEHESGSARAGGRRSPFGWIGRL